MVKRKRPTEQKYFSQSPMPTVSIFYRVDRRLRAELLLAENVRQLLNQRKVDASALAAWCGHKPPWISKILAGQRNFQLNDVGLIADFFGLTVAQLFAYDISPNVERRHKERRAGKDRRAGVERRRTPPTERRQPENHQSRRPVDGIAADTK